MTIRNSAYLSNGSEERAVILYQDYSTYLFDDKPEAKKSLNGTSSKNSYRDFIEELFKDGTGYNFTPPPTPKWGEKIPVDPPPVPA